MSDLREVLSVGLDIGTTTTQVVFSRLHLADLSRMAALPRAGVGPRVPLIRVAEKEILYQSPVHFTPLRSRDEVDGEALERIVREEYRCAGIRPEQIETGAVVVTGEIAKKKNAAEILDRLGGLAGEFVVTVAGPRLEAMMAGRGSGAAAWSREHYARVINVDVGGGSANAAVFELGEFLAAAGMSIGGRLIEIDRDTRIIGHVADPGRVIIQMHGLPIGVGRPAELGPLRAFCDILADLTADLIEGRESELVRALMLTPPLEPDAGRGKLFFSGGVAEYFYRPLPAVTLDAVTVHGDVGPLYGLALREHPRIQTRDIGQPPEKVRATVLGASTQTVTLSGSTIWAERGLLPLKNVPVVYPELPRDTFDPPQIRAAVLDAVRRWDVDPREQDVAIAVDIGAPPDYEGLRRLAQGFADYARVDTIPARPLILIMWHDCAQSLGQTIKALLPDKPLLVVDQVGLGEGDYIDIGTPMLGGRVVPLSIKTLVLPH